MRRISMCVLLAALCLVPRAVFAGMLTFSDSEFLDANWDASVVFETNGPSTVMAMQQTAGGNPGAFRQVDHSFNAQGSIISGHLFSLANYDPASQGAITQVDLAMDLILFDGGDSLVVAYGALLEQGGSFYTGGFVLTPIAPTTNVWEGRSILGLTETDFQLVGGGGNPDFSISGASIQFGFYAANGTDFGATSTSSGIDNYSLTVTNADVGGAVPEPSSLALLLAGVVSGWTVVAGRTRRLRKHATKMG
jgi:PEP-CTERM motif